jgi:hypothetical protein
MTAVVNPTIFTITDPNITAQAVTSFRVLFGQTSGGPYPLVSADDAVTNLTRNADGSLSGTLASLNEQLAPGNWFAVAEAKNVSGYSTNSPEAAITIIPPVPSAPTGFTVS